MAVRRWAVRPQPNGEVSRDEVVQALMDGEALLWRAGGVLTVMPHRAETDLDGERATVAVIFEWKDRTDAKAQPEQVGGAAAATVAPPTPAPSPAVPPATVAAPVAAGGVDGLDEETLPDEDTAALDGAVV